MTGSLECATWKNRLPTMGLQEECASPRLNVGILTPEFHLSVDIFDKSQFPH